MVVSIRSESAGTAFQVLDYPFASF